MGRIVRIFQWGNSERSRQCVSAPFVPQGKNGCKTELRRRLGIHGAGRGLGLPSNGHVAGNFRATADKPGR